MDSKVYKRQTLSDYLAENPLTPEQRAKVDRIKKQLLAEVEEHRQREKAEQEKGSAD